jgi:hypothetical protein
VIVGVGIALRIAQYACDRSLWLNEAMLADNILYRSMRGLFEPLAMIQVAPYGFLVLERAVTHIAGTSELALRAVPLASGVMALLLFAALARRVSAPWTAVIATALFACCWPLIYQSSEVKQYSTDVAVSVALLWCGVAAVSGDPWRGARAVGVALLGAAGVWLSYPALFTAAGVGVVLLVDAHRRRDGEARRGALLIVSAWLVASIPVIAHSRHALTPADALWMQGFWNGGFMPIVPHSLRDVLWLPHAIFDLYRTAFDVRFAALAVVVAALGAWTIWRRDRWVFAVFALPVAGALVASALHLYPLLSRVSLFLAPTAFLAVAMGVNAMWKTYPRVGPVAAAATAALILGPMLRLPEAFRADDEALRGVAGYVAARRHVGEPIYVYVMGDAAFEYYANRFGIPQSAIRYGSVADSSWRQYARQIDVLRGQPRVWVVASHLNSQSGVFGAILIEDYLTAVGRRIDSVATPGAWGQLFDLSDTVATRGVSAKNFSAPANAFVGARPEL